MYMLACPVLSLCPSRGPAGQRPLCPVHRPEHAGPVSVTSLLTRGLSTPLPHLWELIEISIFPSQINQFPPSPRQCHHPSAALGGGQHAATVQRQLFAQRLFRFLQRYAGLDTYTLFFFFFFTNKDTNGAFLFLQEASCSKACLTMRRISSR